MLQTSVRTERPRYHFAPARNWMNDPNGLVFHRGLYHLFFQHNPYGPDHADMSWGHATSTDLIHWDERPVAIRHDDDHDIFSGSVVVDHGNTTGFGTAESPALVAIYTAAARRHPHQAQALAYSLDDGETWQKHAGNPVLDRSSQHFRDPKVFRYTDGDTSYWVMVAVEAEDRRVLLHRSSDLIEWEFLSDYGPAGAVDGVWECPDLFPLPVDGDENDVRWLLLISLNPGGIAGGSGTQYVVGRFDGVRFVPDEPLPVAAPAALQSRSELERFDWLDYGRDCYAGVTFSDLGERVLIAWMDNWDYAKDVPTAPWRGAMSVPRRLELVTREGRPQLRQTAIAPAGEVVADLVDPRPRGDGPLPVRLPVAARVDVRAEVPQGASLHLRLRHDDLGAGGVVVSFHAGELSVDRTAASFCEAFDGISRMAIRGETLELAIWLDAQSVEVFADRGERTLTDLAFAEGTGMTATTGGGARISRITVSDLS